MGRQPRHTNEKRLNQGSWGVLLLAVAYIAAAIVLVSRTLQQPSDGWLFDNSNGVYTAVTSLTNTPSPLQPGDQLLAVAGTPITDDIKLRPSSPPSNWRIGATISYTVLRDGQPVELVVMVVKRPFSAFLRAYRLSGNIWLTNLLWYLIGFGIFFLRPRDTAARLLLLFTTYWTTISVFFQRIDEWSQFWLPTQLFFVALILNLLWAFMFAMMIHFVWAFPLRKWPLTRQPHLILSFLYGVPAVSLALTIITGSFAFYDAALLPMIVTLSIALVVATVHNMWYVHDRVVRAQVGWVALGIAGPLVGAISGGDDVIARVFPALEMTQALGTWMWNLAALLLPICIGIAITRHRLFDINVIIRKTLVYAVLSGLLASVYFGSVVLLQNVIGRVADEQSPLIIVVSTLLIAALFSPLRQRVQVFIDRRFFRQKYDAQQVLAQFTQTARAEVEMEILTTELLLMIQEIMQPEQLSLWLNGNERAKS